ncbi:MAG: hypothetical protein DSZ31_01480 [Gammaproteobacteria bacterium]|nr:MAG: hypothetical protein DSZ31_01480 [Gammaproteobacteria bacterium]
MGKKILISAIFGGVFSLGGIASAVEVLPSCDNGGYSILDGATTCPVPETQKASEKNTSQPKPVNQKTAPKTQKAQPKQVKQKSEVIKPLNTVVERKERTFTDWSSYKEKSPQELLQIIRSLLKEQSPAVSYPQNAPIGCCYGKLVKPPTYKELIIKYVKEDGSLKIKVQPAQFKVVEKKILIRPAYHKIEVIPAKYETKEEKILIAPARPVWTYKDGIYCKVEVPAEYITVTRKVLVEPPKCKKVLVPAEYKIIKVKELVKDASCKKEPIPPKYGIKSKTFMVKGPEVIWDAILCDVNLKPEEIKIIQRKLKELGYYKGAINGKLDDLTMSAVVKFQVDHNLPAGNISIETLKVMGLEEIAKSYGMCEAKNLK